MFVIALRISEDAIITFLKVEAEPKSCRCNLAGRDLNRQYKNVIKEAFPPVFQVILILFLGFMKNILLIAL